jgi:hypothetical protein
MARKIKPKERNVLELTVSLKQEDSFTSVYSFTKLITLETDGKLE